jgi:tRNA(adenine34) deaminase
MNSQRARLVCAGLWIALCTAPSHGAAQMREMLPGELTRIEAELTAFAAEPKNPDNPFVVVCLREAIACLVREATGEIVERGHNRQYAPHFRSDLHAEMDLLNRYEDRIRTLKAPPGTIGNPRRMYEGLVLYSSLEPCPMCTARILNTGITRIVSAAPDPLGGMTSRLDGLPPFWRQLAPGKIFAPAQCHGRLTEIAEILFGSYAKRGYTEPPASTSKP